jgi:hypothetical protein
MRMLSAMLILLAAAHAAQPAPTLVSVKRIWDGGAHNAFTDLIRWRNRWYCTFREGDDHVGGNGRIRVLSSADGGTWTSTALVGEAAIDLRDPKLSITPDGGLMMGGGRFGLRRQALCGARSHRVSSVISPSASIARQWT